MLSGISRVLGSVTVISVGPAWNSWGYLWTGQRESRIKILIIVCNPEKPLPPPHHALDNRNTFLF